MTSHDVRDMLDLPSSSSAPRPKKAKTNAQKPKLGGLAREVQNLGGDNPIAIVPEEAVFKKKRFGSRKAVTKWEAGEFRNSARGDELVLRHWRKAEGKEKKKDREGDTEMGENEHEGKGREEEQLEDSKFAKYNVQVEVPTYTDEEYKEILENDEWSRHETDYLMKMVKEYDLRWPLIWDRYEYIPPDVSEGALIKGEERSVEDLKARYYSIGAAMMALRKPLHQMNTAEFDLHQKMLYFQPRQEKLRKDFLEGVFTRTKEEAREEESLMVELKRILDRSQRFMEERRELYARLDYPTSSSNVSPYTTSQGLHQLFQQLLTADKSKRKKTASDGQTPGASTPVGANTPGGFNDRREPSVRESISGPSGNGGNSAVGNKKGSISSTAANPSERRQLNADEQKIYGVSYHDRLSGGPYFRHDRLVKSMTSKSAVQQARYKNVLTELNIAEKPTMATMEVVQSYEDLYKSIGILLDSRKVADKMAGEISVLKEQLEEKKRRKARAMGMYGAGDEKKQDGGDKNGSAHGSDGKKECKDAGASTVVPTTEPGDAKTGDANGKQTEGGVGNTEGSGGADAGAAAAAVTQKRSASVLSTGSNKSLKRQKK